MLCYVSCFRWEILTKTKIKPFRCHGPKSGCSATPKQQQKRGEGKWDSERHPRRAQTNSSYKDVKSRQSRPHWRQNSQVARWIETDTSPPLLPPIAICTYGASNFMPALVLVLSGSQVPPFSSFIGTNLLETGRRRDQNIPLVYRDIPLMYQYL